MSGEFNYNLASAYGDRFGSGGFDYPPYSSNGRNYALTTLLVPSITSTRVANRGPNDPWLGRSDIGTWERISPTGLPVPRLVINNGTRMELIQASPRLIFQGPSNFQAQEVLHEQPSSRLSQDEQDQAVEQLKKTTYNPGPKRMATRLCLYYRDQARAVAKEKGKEKEEDQGKRCAVCLEDFEPRDAVMLTPCNHMFHEECIVPWARSQGQCPVCRFSLVSKPAASTSAAPGSRAGSGTARAGDGTGSGVAGARVDGDGVFDTGELSWFVQAVEEAMMRGTGYRH